MTVPNLLTKCGHLGDHMKRNQSKAREIGIRELKSRISELVRTVKEERARYVVSDLRQSRRLDL
jgi:hypothetical protein